MYLRPEDIRFLTAAGLSATRISSTPTPTSEAVRPLRRRRRCGSLRRLLGKALMTAGTRLQQVGRKWMCLTSTQAEA